MKKTSIGRLLGFVGIIILSVGLLCNSFEVISIDIFRIITLIGIVVEIVALFFILKRKEF